MKDPLIEGLISPEGEILKFAGFNRKGNIEEWLAKLEKENERLSKKMP